MTVIIQVPGVLELKIPFLLIALIYNDYKRQSQRYCGSELQEEIYRELTAW